MTAYNRLTDSISFTNPSAKIQSGDIVFSELNLFIRKAYFHDHIMSMSPQCNPDHFDALYLKKINISNAGFNKDGKLPLPTDFDYEQFLRCLSLKLKCNDFNFKIVGP